MISLIHILAQYPRNLQAYRENILKEYLQYKILRSIYESSYANKLIFLGGTALRIVHGNTRFSEDLDFDNLGLSNADFVELGNMIKKDLELEGLDVEIVTTTHRAYRLKIRIPSLLFDAGLSSLPDQKILIQVDTVPQNFSYTPDTPLLNKFEVFTQIFSTPKDILLAQKIYASTNRKRLMGRDFFDITFLYGIGAKPNFTYLGQHIGVSDRSQLKKYLLEKTTHLDFSYLAKDVEPFLFFPQDSKRVKLFREFVEQMV